ncbi:site-specific DNA recombinase [Symbiobacterium terraclitae]|uniref:Site-specific DNA recombinase n=1 Tax=Symbiobacterium terraclitae TaxID=557451 RepID=A0ABS4JVJ5_9FIRM|nr:recombinase family protein [Symbiobacterium terraclitae]MBP2019577.1 site-specific DNA recombinase [Symbiobacterium terraclitae]
MALTTTAVLVLVAIYIRVSTEDQARRGYSIPEQRAACLEMARRIAEQEEQRLGRPVQLQTVEFVDTVSGELLERPELDRLREFVRQQRPHAVVCLDPDRFSRATYAAIIVANEIENAGTALRFVQHDYQKTPEGRLFFTLRLAIAEYDKAKLLERSTRGKRGKIQAGGLPTGLNMFGYQYDRLTQEVRPHPVEARWVQQIFLWAAEGLGVQQIANRLNEAGVRTKRGGARWYRGTVAKILRNRGYIGELQVNRYDARGIGVQRQLPKTRRTRVLTQAERPREEWVTIRIPPLITRELWDEVQAVRRTNPRRLAQQRDGLLSGLMACGYCGGPVHYRPHKTLGHAICCANRYPYQRDLKRPEPPCRELPHQPVRPIEEYVWRQIELVLTDPEYLAQYIADRQRRRQQKVPSLATGLQRELSLLEDQLQAKLLEQGRILAVVASGAVDPQVAEAALKPYLEQIASLRERISDLKHRIALVADSEQQYQRTVEQATDLRTALGQEVDAVRRNLARLGHRGKQLLVRKLVERVVVFREQRVEVDFLA